MKRALLCLTLSASGFLANAQLSHITDINNGPASSSPTRLSVIKDRLVFFADDGINGNELWSMDSMVNIVYNINPGSGSSGTLTNHQTMAVANGKIYFPANDGITGWELYSWDGDPANAPMMVKDVNSGSMNEVVAMNGKVYFTASTATYGNELYMHDPVANNTNIVANIAAGTASSNPQNITEYKGMLYFSASTATTGVELYRYDPKTNNATLVMDINTGTNGSDPQSLTVIDGKLYFSATTAAFGRELYSYDSVTVLRLTDLTTGAGNGVVSASPAQKRIASFNGGIYFSGDNGTGSQLYRYNPNNGTATLVYSINPTGSSFPTSFINYGKKLYFSAYDDLHGIELWRYDGTNAPEMVADIDTIGSGNPGNMAEFKNVLYFAASTPDFGTELYSYTDSVAFTGVKKVSFDATVKVYPNPASTEAYIELDLKNNETLAVRVADMTGKVVFSTGAVAYMPGNNRITVPMASLPAGNYIYNITGTKGGTYVSGKLLKQ